MRSASIIPIKKSNVRFDQADDRFKGQSRTARSLPFYGCRAHAVACHRLQSMRPGRAVYLDTLIARHGSDFKIPQLVDVLSVDCPKRKSQSAYDLCGIHCPRLAELFPPPPRSG